MLRFLTAGESHGICLVAVLEGMVAGLKLDMNEMNAEMARRQTGYGRGGRMLIEKDRATIVSGVRQDVTIGSPIAIQVANKDFKINELPVVHRPRPGHADLTGVLKYGREDVRDILERASARETAARVAVGGIAKQFLRAFGVEITSHIVEIGGVKAPAVTPDVRRIRERAEKSPVRCADAAAAKRMMRVIDRAKKNRDTIGGVFEVVADGVVAGIGSHAQYDRRLNAILAFAVMSIQAVKGVEVGMGFEVARRPGSQVHDEIHYDKSKKRFFRKTNRAGGIEGGMSNGEPLVLRAATKPYATLMKPLSSVNIKTKDVEAATVERSDVTAVPACGVIAEAMVAFELSRLYLEKFGGDSLAESLRNYQSYVKAIEKK